MRHVGDRAADAERDRAVIQVAGDDPGQRAQPDEPRGALVAEVADRRHRPPGGSSKGRPRRSLRVRRGSKARGGFLAGQLTAGAEQRPRANWYGNQLVCAA